MVRKPMTDEEKKSFALRMKKAREVKKQIKLEREAQGLSVHDRKKPIKSKVNDEVKERRETNELEEKILKVKKTLIRKTKTERIKIIRKRIKKYIEKRKRRGTFRK
tara:strand:+ start:85 stop:402 length:318 start_codon:yes stop_codon:yes gene_type:complete